MSSGEQRRPSKDEVLLVGATGLLAEVGRWLDPGGISVFPVLWLFVVVRWSRGGTVAPWLLFAMAVLNVLEPFRGVDEPEAQGLFLVGGVVPAAVLLAQRGAGARVLAIGGAAVVLAACVAAIDAGDEPTLADVLDLSQHSLNGDEGLTYAEHDGLRFPDLGALDLQVSGARRVELPDGVDAILTSYSSKNSAFDDARPSVNYVILTGDGRLGELPEGTTVVRAGAGGRRVALRDLPVTGPANVWTASFPGDRIDPRPPAVAMRRRAGRTVVAFAWPASRETQRLVERVLLEERPAREPPARPPEPVNPPLTRTPAP